MLIPSLNVSIATLLRTTFLMLQRLPLSLASWTPSQIHSIARQNANERRWTQRNTENPCSTTDLLISRRPNFYSGNKEQWVYRRLCCNFTNCWLQRGNSETFFKQCSWGQFVHRDCWCWNSREVANRQNVKLHKGDETRTGQRNTVLGHAGPAGTRSKWHA